MQAKQLSFSVGDMQYAANAWGDSANRPVLALHGWLDNAASFSMLAPLLADQVYIVAPDLAGHGLTTHRPWSGSYNIWDDLHDLLGLADAAGFEKFSLLAHSRGAMIATLLAVAAPERVNAVILLDGFLAPPQADNKTAKQLREHVRDFRKYSKPGPSVLYPSVDTAIEARQKQLPMPADAARVVVERNLEKLEEGYRWRHDRRLKAASAIKFGAGQRQDILAALTAPTLMILADQGYSRGSGLAASIPNDSPIQQVTIAGIHHFHMVAESAKIIAEQVLHFLDNKLPTGGER